MTLSADVNPSQQGNKEGTLTYEIDTQANASLYIALVNDAAAPYDEELVAKATKLLQS